MRKLIYLIISVLIIPGCTRNDSKIQLVNTKASLPASFNFDRMGLKVMSSFINKKSATTSVLYANPIALQNAIKGNHRYLTGEVMALVTWSQQADCHWFGARIPAGLQSVEVVIVSDVQSLNVNYKKYGGKYLLADPDTSNRQDRINFILNQQPSVMP